MNELEEQIFEAKKNGLSDQEIGEKYNVNLRFIEKVITKYLGVNVSSPTPNKKVKMLQPKKFTLETTTVWSFKSRGNWATHNGNYRGNWSPYVPRNIILRYSKENELVLDCFCGAGTTGVECKLTNRNFIGIDINPNAIVLAKENIDFPIYGTLSGRYTSPKIIFNVGDAKDLSFIDDESIDLICTHPPYANIIHYTDNHKQDLSFCNLNDFLEEMSKVAKGNYRVLKEGRYCAVLIGDMRKKKHIIPLGFWLINVYLKNGFSLKELVIKRQHNCKTTGFWYKNSIKYNFLLLAHEYLAIFKKCSSKQEQMIEVPDQSSFKSISTALKPMSIEKLESTTVWIFGNKNWHERTIQNLIKRYDVDDYNIINGITELRKLSASNRRYSLLVLTCTTLKCFQEFCNSTDEIVNYVHDDGYLTIICSDIRLKDGTIYPLGIKVESYLRNRNDLKIKEIVMISLENDGCKIDIDSKDNLIISHKYLLIYHI